jgi:hypothetical protein|tara:strand:+ start:979 stop:1416 length:438 start_codon:yes stop_codon:yes gene_type:complete
MKIEDIYEMWAKDSEIDQTNVSGESANIPKLHNKYFRVYMEEGMKLKQLRAKYKQLKLLKEQYYRGELDITELQQHGWEPQPLKILRTDIGTYIDADQDMINLSLKVGMIEEKVNYLEAIIKMISNRGFQLKTIVDWERFRTGAM